MVKAVLELISSHFEMADKAKLVQSLLLRALYCMNMRRINYDSATKKYFISECSQKAVT